MRAISLRFKQWPRPWRVLAWSAAGLYAAYLLAGNLFLNTPLFDRVTNLKPQKFVMRTGPAITLLPGHVIAWNVHMRGHANHTVYVFHADRASARLALWPLFRREVRVPRLEAAGVSAEVTRVEDAVPPPPRGNQGWTLRFDAIHSESIAHARLGKLLIIGRGSGTVGFRKQLRGGPSQLYDSQVAFRDAIASYDGVQLLDAMKVEARFGYPWHYRDQAPGIAKFDLLRGSLNVDARSQGLRVDTEGGAVAVSSAPVAGQLQAQLSLQGGTLQPGSRAIWRVPLQAGAGAPDRGLLAIQMDAAQDIRLQARLPAREGTGAWLKADLHVAGRKIPFREPGQLLERTSGRVQGEWRFTSLNWIPALFLRRPWLQLDGGGTLRGDLQLEEGELAAGSTVDIPEAAATAEVAGVRMTGTASAHGALEAGSPTRAVLDVRVPRFTARAGGAQGETLFDGRALSLQLSGDGRLREFRRDMRARLHFNNASIPDLTAYNRYLGKGQVRLLGGTGSLTGDVELDTDGRVGHGTATLLGRGAHLQVAGLDLLGDAQVDADLRRGDFKQRYFDLSGTSIQLRKVRVGQQERSAPWQGKVLFKQGRIDAQAPFRVDASADLTMSDAGPLLGVFAERSDYPRWALSLLDAGQVNARTRLRWQAGHLMLDGLEAENERLSVRARLDLTSQHKRGDLYLRWGLLGAGIELDGKQRQWHLAGAREWFEERPALLPAEGAPARAD
ncbi:hypothetical protein [Stenotrophomonas sp. NPDC077659]|uniref:hypothetical protein n=1 Tax=Stenotrophomonas sp. NPDC077659 TaxID=3390694 RepID=UPI003D01B9D4